MLEFGVCVDLGFLNDYDKLISHEGQDEADQHDGKDPACDSRIVVFGTIGEHLLMGKEVTFEETLA